MLIEKRTNHGVRAFARRLHQRCRIPENGVGRNDIGAIYGGGTNSFRLEKLGHQQRGKTLADCDRFIDRPRRPLAQHQTALRDESSSKSVTPAIAETTITTGRAACCSAEMRAATRMRSAEPMLVPPNFITKRLFIFF